MISLADLEVGDIVHATCRDHGCKFPLEGVVAYGAGPRPLIVWAHLWPSGEGEPGTDHVARPGFDDHLAREGCCGLARVASDGTVLARRVSGRCPWCRGVVPASSTQAFDLDC